MRVKFSDIKKENFNFVVEQNGVTFSGVAKKHSHNSVKCSGKIVGATSHLCDRCSDEFLLPIDEEVEVIASDGVTSSSTLENIVEFFDGFVDFEEILISELESYKSDYFYCEKCK